MSAQNDGTISYPGKYLWFAVHEIMSKYHESYCLRRRSLDEQEHSVLNEAAISFAKFICEDGVTLHQRPVSESQLMRHGDGPCVHNRKLGE